MKLSSSTSLAGVSCLDNAPLNRFSHFKDEVKFKQEATSLTAGHLFINCLLNGMRISFRYSFLLLAAFVLLRAEYGKSNSPFLMRFTNNFI